MTVRVLVGDVIERLREMPDESVNCVVTSPPYWGLRDYGVDGQIGLEPSPDEFVAALVEVFREVRRVLRADGTLWLNLGDSYGSTGGDTYSGFNERYNGTGGAGSKQDATLNGVKNRSVKSGLRAKNLLGIPWRVAFALQADGWFLRQDIIWCLSGGTVVYARTQKGDMPASIKDLARLDPATVKLWNGEKWTQVLGWSRTSRNADELDIILRSGERISCTPNHRFPTGRGMLRADEIEVGDTLVRVTLPEPTIPKSPAHMGVDAAWFAGLYLAEGSMSGDTIQISGNASETERFARVRNIAESYGGSATCTIDENNQSIRVYGKVLVAIIKELLSGRTSKDKCLSPVCWRYGNNFLSSILEGYLSGDGHRDEGNNRWRLGFTRNYNLERDLRVMAARLNFTLALKPVFVSGFGKKWPAFKGEIRFERSGHGNEADTAEVVEIRRSRCREVYDVGVDDEPHLFALASGILTHNSKPNPMPESVTDRCTKAHEYIFLLSKSPKYFFDNLAIKEAAVTNDSRRPYTSKGAKDLDGRADWKSGQERDSGDFTKRNKRSVWTVATRSFKGAHFATFPPDLIEPCILAGSAPGDVVLDPFGGAGTTGLVADRLNRDAILIELNPEYAAMAMRRISDDAGMLSNITEKTP